MNVRPSGTVTFLFTDIESSTRLWEQDPADMAERVAVHDEIIHTVVARHRGVVFSSQGDSFAAAFDNPTDGIAAAVDAQLALRDVLAVRMAVHAGPVETRDGDYFGPTLNRCGRLRDGAHGGQIICSQAVADLTIELPRGVGLLDLGEHRLRDLGRRERIHQITHPDLDSGFPPLKTNRVESTNLPGQVTSFVGRRKEMAQIATALRSARLVTLVGAGGCGKSRLAQEVAGGLFDEYPDGVWMVELASVGPDLVASAVASVLGVQERPDSSLTDAVVASSKQRHLLLILDNCEHVLDAVTPLVHGVITGTTAVRVLATSRAPLHTSGETTYPVPPLPLPGPEAETDTDTCADAVQLFVDRAAAVSPDFELTTTNAPVVASICRHLDGIPLAIELAATTTRFLPLDEIEGRLDDRFRVLGGANRDPLFHHRTLEAAMDWSFEQLRPDQRILFGRLAVFTGGWTLEAAERVCSAPPIDVHVVLPLLNDLVDQSLVAIVEGDPTGRCRLLETIHAYASGLGQVTEELRQRHASWCQELADRVRPWITANRTDEAMLAFRADMPNIRNALEHYAEVGDSHGYCALLAAIRRFLFINRSYAEADRYFERALGYLAKDLPAGLRGEILMGAGWNMSRAHGIHAEASAELLHRAVALLESAGDDRHLSEAYSYLTVIAQNPEYAELALEAALRSGDPTAAARPHHYLGITRFLAGRYEEAIGHFRHALEGLADAHLTAFATVWLAMTLVRIGRSDEALELANEALATCERISDGGGLESALQALGEVALVSGRPVIALEALDRRIGITATYRVDPGVYASAAHAAAQVGDISKTLRYLEVVEAVPGSDFLLDDNLDHAFLAVAQLGTTLVDADLTVRALAAEVSFRDIHTVLPNLPREQLIDRLIGQARELLPPNEFDTVWEAGRSLDIAALIDLAVQRCGDSGRV